MLRKLERRLGGLGLAEHEVPALDVHLDPGGLGDLPADDGLGQRILDVLLDGAPELAGAVGRVVALLDQGRLRPPA